MMQKHLVKLLLLRGHCHDLMDLMNRKHMKSATIIAFLTCLDQVIRKNMCIKVHIFDNCCEVTNKIAYR